MEEIIYSQKYLTIIYIIHFILEVIIIGTNINYYIAKYWIKLSFKIIFLIGIILDSFFGLISLILLYFIYFQQNLFKSFFNCNKIATYVFLIFAVVIGIILVIIFWVNLSKFSSFFIDCPYNYSSEDFKKIIDNLNEYKSNEICQQRLCLKYNSDFINDNTITIITDDNNILNIIDAPENNKYLCTFDSSLDFDNNDVICEKMRFNSNNEFFNFCNKYIFYYLCKRESNISKYNININKECPSENLDSMVSNTSDFFILFNIILGFLPWTIELIYYYKFSKNKVQIHEQQQEQVQNQNNSNIVQNVINIINNNQNENQLRNLLNRTANSSEINIRRNNTIQNSVNPNHNENQAVNNNISINENIIQNNNINNNSNINNNNENIDEIINENNQKTENTQIIFVGKEAKSSFNDDKEDEKDTNRQKNMHLITESENDDENKNIFSLTKHTKNDIAEDDNFDENTNIKGRVQEIHSIKKNKIFGNMFYLKKEENKIHINRFVNSNNKTLNYFENNEINIIANKRNEDLKQPNKSEYHKKDIDILEKIEKNCFTCKKEKNEENKDRVSNLTRTVKQNRKDRIRVMDNVWKILNNNNSKSELKNKKQEKNDLNDDE